LSIKCDDELNHLLVSNLNILMCRVCLCKHLHMVMYNLLGVDGPYNGTCEKEQDEEALLKKEKDQIHLHKDSGNHSRQAKAKGDGNCPQNMIMNDVSYRSLI
jgi:hypothetical protein